MIRTLLVVMLALVGCKSKSSAYPTVVIDDQHLQMLKGAEKPLDYTVSPASGLILDSAGYKFKIPEGQVIDGPDTVNIVIGRNQMYSAEWKPIEDRLTLDSKTLTPVGKAPPFAGFTAGTTIAIGIGHAVKGGPVAQFVVLWVGMAAVK